ncbi:hypothetical protein [Ferruginibacter sp.]|nr:hypothetical protein [Ferruginibacter sp.]
MKTLIKIGATIVTSLVLNNVDAKNLVGQIKIFENLNSISQPIEYLQVILLKKTEFDSLIKFKEKYPAVYKTFSQEFNNAENIKYTVDGKILFLTFNSKGYKVTAVYSMNGHNKYSITNIGTVLPKTVVDKIKTVYPAYTIFYGKSISISSETIYQVIIENNYEYRVINFSNEEMEEIKKNEKHFVK